MGGGWSGVSLSALEWTIAEALSDEGHKVEKLTDDEYGCLVTLEGGEATYRVTLTEEADD